MGADDTKKSEADKPAEKPAEKPKPRPIPIASAKPPATMQVTVQRTGLEEADYDKGYVRVLKTSYLHGGIYEKGAVAPWPKGVNKLGDNLEPYEG